MKYLHLTFLFFVLSLTAAYAQQGKQVQGVVVDTANVTQPGTTVQLKSDLGDSTTTFTNADGKFTFTNVKGKKIKLYISSLGFESIIKNYSLPDTTVLVLPNIVLHTTSNLLKEVVIKGVNPVKFKEDTVEYKVAAYPVRDNAPVEDVLKKVPGLEVDANGNVTAQGKSITKVRINGKDFMGGDLQAATKNLPADILEGIQIIDDYGDQANLTGIRTGDPQKVLNLTIRADRNYGYTVQGTAGAGKDLLPAAPGVKNDTRYLGTVNYFNFKGNRQLTVLANVNNTNVNTFNFGGGGGGGNRGGGGGGGGGFTGGGGGGGNRGGGNGLATVANGITDARSIGLNYRDQWGAKLAVYGSYSYSNNQTYTENTSFVTNNNTIPSTSNTTSKQNDHPINQRFTFNLEWKPDTINYLKVTPNFSYSQTNSSGIENGLQTQNNALTRSYTTRSSTTSSSPNYGMQVLFNHRFNANGRNLSIFLNSSMSQSTSKDNPITTYAAGTPTAPGNQLINADNKNSSVTANLSYLEPIGKVSYLELNYTYSRSYTANDKETDTLSTTNTYNNYTLLSNNYKSTFVTNRIGLNYRIVESKYNLTLGLGVQPGTLDGQSLTTGLTTHVNQFNWVPTARYVYNFSRNKSFNFQYSGQSSQPSFTQLQPVIDFSSASLPVQGNPNLKPTFTNSFQMRYNNYGIESGNIFFFTAAYTTASNQIVNNTVTYQKLSSAVLAANPNLRRLQNSNLTQFLNADGYHSISGQFTYSKPWQERKYTLIFQGNASYTNNIGYSSKVDSNNVQSPALKNIAKTLSLTPGMRFRVDITDVMDVQALTNYSINKTDNSIQTGVFSSNQNIRSWVIGLSGKNYLFTDWTVGYDLTKQTNYGYASSVAATNPTILNAYLERRFLKGNRATIRVAAFDVFNQNTGFSVITNGNTVTQSNVNRLGRYFLATIAIRLQKFAGKAPVQERRFDGGAGGPGGRDGGRGGFGGPGGPGGPGGQGGGRPQGNFGGGF